jgi:tetratricopeptide (TPR) repeat protein
MNTELQDHRRERGIPNSVFRTWKLSYDQMKEQDPRAAEMLSLMAMLDRQQIPETLLRRQGEGDLEFLTGLGILDGLSLITKEVGKETLTVHRLVQLSVHVWLEQHQQKVRYEEEALALIADTFPNGEHENKKICESLLPHAQSVLRYETVSEKNRIQRGKLLYNIGWFDWRQGRYDVAYERVSEAHNLNEKLLGQDDIETLGSLSLLGLVVQYQGKYEAAEEMNRRALEGREKVLGMEHPSTLISVSNLAGVLRTYLPQKSKGSILITSRNRDAVSRLTGRPDRVLKIEQLGKDDARNLLRKKLPNDKSDEED